MCDKLLIYSASEVSYCTTSEDFLDFIIFFLVFSFSASFSVIVALFMAI